MTPTLSTQALVLHTTEYSETSVIAKIFTRQLGVRSYIIKGVRRGGSRTKQNLLQPLTHLDMVVYNNPKTSLNYIKEMGPHLAVDNYPDLMHFTPREVYNALCFFMTEVLYKTLREEEPMPALFDYVVEALDAASLACESHDPCHLPITFLLTVARHLGIEPLDNYSLREPLFDLREGHYCFYSEMSLNTSSSHLLHYYLQALHADEPFPLATLSQRTDLINHLLDYFQLHLSEFRNFKSHEILHTILH